MTKQHWTEEELVSTLSGVLLKDEEIDGLDEDLVAYISGLISTQLLDAKDEETAREILEESMIPFLDSVECPPELIQAAMDTILSKAGEAVMSSAAETTGARKLKQGVIQMSSTLTGQDDDEGNRYTWGTTEQVKANANFQIDAYHDKTSAKDRRKQRQELEKTRRDLAALQQQDQTSAKAGVSVMLLPTVVSKERDVNLQRITLSLDNGTQLLEQGDLKFTYQRRYGLIGENGVGKTTLLNKIANWQDLEGFPQHLRVLHVRQELHIESEEITVLQAVLEADVERQTLLQQEKEILSRLEKPEEGADGKVELTVEERKKRLAENQKADGEFADDLKRLNAVYERLQLLNADTATTRAATILSGLQFTPDMQNAPIKSLSGGWRMRVALAAALLIEPDILMLDEPTNHLDLEAVIWLERYLVEYPHTVILVSHDRGFLNEVCTDTIEFKHKKLTCKYNHAQNCVAAALYESR